MMFLVLNVRGVNMQNELNAGTNVMGSTCLRGFDIDGVITVGFLPKTEFDIIVTGRSFQDYNLTMRQLELIGLDTDKHVPFFNHIDAPKVNATNGAIHKANIINLIGIHVYYEDSWYQAGIIAKRCPECDVFIVYQDEDGKVITETYEDKSNKK